MEAIPLKMREGFAATMRDPDIISCRTEIGLVDSHVLNLVRSLAQEQYNDKWKQQLEKALDKLKTELDAGDEVRVDESLSAIAEAEVALLHQESDQKAWSEILMAIESRRKLVETERRLLEAHQAAVDVGQMKAILLHLLTAVREHVLPLDGGRKAVDGIALEVRKLLIPRPDRAKAVHVGHTEEASFQ